MKYLSALFFAIIVYSISLQAQVSVIPKPNELKYTEGNFNFSKGLDVKVIRGDDGTKRLQKQLTDFIKNKKINIVPFGATAISLNLAQTTELPADGYSMMITPNSVAITSSGNTGLFYGLQTLFQLMKSDSVKSIPCLEIKDIPAYTYRGMHLDVVHHFFGIDVIKQYLDAMAKLKLNQFHWQLADAKKWRLELKSDTTLTDKENYYTQEQIKDVVKYAQERFINIVPEVKFPVGTDSLYDIKKITDEVTALFSGNYFHAGNGFTDKATLQLLIAKNKKIIGTDNLVSDKTVLLSYKNSKNGISAAAKGKDVIMAPRQLCSFDYYQDWDDEKKSFDMTFLPLDKSYTFSPAGKIKDNKTLQHILGGEAYVSTEFIKNAETLEYQIFPRLVAFAECVWTSKSRKNFADFERRLKAQQNFFFKEKEMPKIDMVRIKPKK
jgi:hexosaminidase